MHDGVARRYLVESPSDAHEFAFGCDRPSRHTRVLGGAPAGHRRRPATKLGVRAGLGVGAEQNARRVVALSIGAEWVLVLVCVWVCVWVLGLRRCV